jgi:hypothetical protein
MNYMFVILSIVVMVDSGGQFIHLLQLYAFQFLCCVAIFVIRFV